MNHNVIKGHIYIYIYKYMYIYIHMIVCIIFLCMLLCRERQTGLFSMTLASAFTCSSSLLASCFAFLASGSLAMWIGIVWTHVGWHKSLFFWRSRGEHGFMMFFMFLVTNVS